MKNSIFILLACLWIILPQRVFAQTSTYDYPSLSKLGYEQLKVKLSYFQKQNDTLGQAYVYKFLADLPQIKNKSKFEAIDYSLKAIELFTIKDEQQKNWQEILMANQFSELGDGRLSIEYANNLAKNVMAFANKTKNSMLKMTTLQTMFRLSAVSDSAKYSSSAIINSCDSLVKLGVITDFEQLKLFHFQSGQHSSATKQFPKAIEHFENAKKMAITRNDIVFEAVCDLFVAQSARMMNKHKQAIEIINAKISPKLFKNNPDLERWTMQELAYDYTALKDYKKANEYWNRHFEVQIAIAQNNQKNYEFGETMSTLIVKNQQNTNEKLKLSNSLNSEINLKYRYLIGGLLFAILGGIAIVFFRFKYNKLSSISEKNVMLLKGQELERSRFSKELHDSVGSSVAAIRTNLLQLENNSEKENLVNLIDSLYDDVRNISHQLYPSYLIREGLQVAISDYIHLINADQKITYNYFGTEKIKNPSATVSIFRIIQELLNNAIKHAKATKIEVETMFSDDSLFIKIQDNGIGIDKLRLKEGIGLQNVNSRISQLEGTMEYISEANIGTTYMLTFMNV
jgi:two-component system, NarL family, sensor kinase